MAERVEVLITGDASGLVRATDQAAGAMADFGKSAKSLSGFADALRSDFGRMTTAFAAAQVGVSAVIGAFNQAAAAVQAMNAEVVDAERVASKLIAVFDGAEGAAARLTAQAEDLARSTVFFDDDAIKSAAAALRAFDLTEQEISKLLPAAVNLATVFGTDLDSAASKLALGINGSTRGLREFGIIAKEGADRADLLAQILERGEKAAKGAADAQGGLRGATEGLKKAQGEFNQALGTLLSGPQSAFLNFLTDATNRAAGLANSMSGAVEQIGKAARVIDPLTGKIVEATGTGGKDLFGPGSLTAKYMGKTAPAAPAPAPAKKAEERPARAGRERAAAPSVYSGMGPGVMPGLDVFRASQAEAIGAELKAAENNAKIKIDAAKDAADIAKKAADDEAAIRLASIQQANDLLANGITTAGRVLVDILKGDASLGGIIRSLGGLATTAGGAFGGPIGAALAGIGVEVAAAVADGMNENKTAADRLREAGDRLITAGEVMTAAERDRRIESAKTAARAAGLSENDITRALAVARGENPPTAGRRTQGLPGVGGTVSFVGGVPTVGPLGQEFGVVGAGMESNVAELGNLTAEPLPAFVTGAPGQGMLSPGAGAAPPGPVAGIDTSSAFAELVRVLRELANVQLDEAGAGMTERQPLFVFDVSAGKDEFTRAPRGLFFRPVGTGRGVDGGQAISGVSGNSTNRRTMGRTG